MTGGCDGSGAAVGRDGTPVDPQAHPENRQAATWVAGESHSPHQYAVVNNPTPSASHPVNHSNGGGGGGGETNPYVIAAPVPPAYSSSSSSAYGYSSGRRPMDRLSDVLNRCGKRFEEATRKAEFMADSVWHHLKTGPSVTDAAMARVAQGTKVLTEGGQEKVFQHTFQTLPGEKLLKAYACYISTSTGLVIGTLYLSTTKLAFCSDNPLCHSNPSGLQEWVYYKVVLPLDQLSAVNPSASRTNPSERYIQIITGDPHEFWFMGFISYDKALKNICEALHRSRSH